jgi:hypothetical protein
MGEHASDRDTNIQSFYTQERSWVSIKEEVSIEARPEVPDHSLPVLALTKYVWFETA